MRWSNWWVGQYAKSRMLNPYVHRMEFEWILSGWVVTRIDSVEIGD